MIIPKFLKMGDTVGVTAPSYSAVEENDGIRFRNAMKKLKEAGYGTFLTPDTFGYGEGRKRHTEILFHEEHENPVSRITNPYTDPLPVAGTTGRYCIPALRKLT